MANAWERYILNPATNVAHDAAHLSEECNTDQIEAKVRKPSVPPTYRMCRHCAANIKLAGEPIPAEVEHEPVVEVVSPNAAGLEAATGGGADTQGPGGAAVTDQANDVGGANDVSRGAPDPLPDGGGGPGRGEAGAPDAGGEAGGAPQPGAIIAKHAIRGIVESYQIGNSSNLVSLEYNTEQGTLRTKFKNGWVYVYDGVPAQAVADVMAAPSPGHAYDELIKKPKYAYEREPAS